ncbi:type II toxin-antitoxin system RelE family toxin [Acetobacter persici]|uniref:type II toxin-antitoxin system RelE family toxin n=1 Tax=Acetobacter persici TaxID=1076596 RepID=UPI001BAC601C|nr:type II toxin-antitoxin system RelE/ParE family toxin [Acetobacter persici]MBS1017250.1 type II toxin-antitoxin system RelE/ParE family toxin [Acetobacter persici]
MNLEKTYTLSFLDISAREFNKLDSQIKLQFLAKLEEILKDPYNAPRLRGGLKNCFKIKLRSAGYRLVYKVNETEIEVLVVAVGKRNNDDIYNTAKKRI